ncbi:radical SAM family heme chaperone HemW [Rhabdothermincola salaria]|uniref:radical SAM family heme chaperone HemW n=1 Tax=Rhabdothermincola salaria TaxID=2903142 RepID=UPI001E4553A7|nr:radical SAM family heme chaperone HemW [Rhabdothermincola salaria]
MTSAPLGAPAPAFGVYVHIPFCARRCDYCAFATWTDRHHLTDAYLGAVRADIDGHRRSGAMGPATSVFVGGGTPSLVPAADLVAVLAGIPLAPGAEVTVECNPDTVDEHSLATYRAGGVTRLSFGVQSMVPEVLVALGRSHDPDNVRRAVDAARAVGFETFNLDLIYGGAGETLAQWRTTLEAVVALDPPHVSAYALTVEAGTPLAADPARHPDDDDQADKYLMADEVLGASGLENYEISNWARAGHRCRHNELYWAQGDYLGVGCAAHSHRGGRRWWNLRTPERYIEAVQAGESTEAAHEDLDDDRRRIEGLQLSLRTGAGVPEAALAADDLAVLDGLVEHRAGRIRLTVEGRLLANEVAVRLR